MSLNVKSGKEGKPATNPQPLQGTSEEGSLVLDAPVRKIQLELALYKRYTRKDQLFEAEVAYSFSEAQARVLLAERDPRGVPIWRRYRRKTAPVVVQEQEQRRMVDMELTETALEGITPSAETRISVGTDDELADILSDDGDEVEI